MDELNKLISPETQATVLQIIAVLSLALPLLEKLAAKTKTKIDDDILQAVQTILGLVPRVRLGGQPSTPSPAKQEPSK